MGAGLEGISGACPGMSRRLSRPVFRRFPGFFGISDAAAKPLVPACPDFVPLKQAGRYIAAPNLRFDRHEI